MVQDQKISKGRIVSTMLWRTIISFQTDVWLLSPEYSLHQAIFLNCYLMVLQNVLIHELNEDFPVNSVLDGG